MYPPRQLFNLLKPIRKSEYDRLRAYLTGLFDKSRLVADGLMGAAEELEFDVNCIQEGSLCRASFSVSVSGHNPTDRLFDVIIDRFKRTNDDIYIIGAPGSGYVN